MCSVGFRSNSGPRVVGDTLEVMGLKLVGWGVVVLCILQLAAAVSLPNCSYPAVYAFGDSLTDTGNSIAAFPNQFANAELDPNGILFPQHAADRYTDGKLLLDFLGTLSI